MPCHASLLFMREMAQFVKLLHVKQGVKVSRKLIDSSTHDLTMTGKLCRNRHRSGYKRLCAVYTEH